MGGWGKPKNTVEINHRDTEPQSGNAPTKELTTDFTDSTDNPQFDPWNQKSVVKFVAAYEQFRLL
jgi:hypothetical protein